MSDDPTPATDPLASFVTGIVDRAVSNHSTKTDNRLGELSDMVAGLFEKLDESIAGVRTSVEHAKPADFTTVHSRLDDLDAQIKALQRKVDAMDQSQQQLDTKITTYVNSVTAYVTAMQTWIAAAKTVLAAWPSTAPQPDLSAESSQIDAAAAALATAAAAVPPDPTIPVITPAPTSSTPSTPSAPPAAPTPVTPAEPLPNVMSLSPATGATTGGTLVTISGQNFSGATAVNFGTVAGNNVVPSADGSSLTVLAPAAPAGPVDVTVVTPNGTSAVSEGDMFTFQ